MTTAGCGTLAGGSPGGGDLALIDRAMQQVEKNYVVPVRSEKLVDNALKGMLTRLDPHSDYMDEREYQELLATTSGEFGGVGIEISVENGVPQVIAAIEGTPAAAAGVEPGDRIVKANGQPIIGLEISEVVRQLRGPPGTPVVLTIARANRQSFDVPIMRAVIRVDSVKSALRPGRIGYIRITTFNENTPAVVRAALARLQRKPAAGWQGWCSICATMPAGCSTPRSRSPPIFSIPGRSSRRGGGGPTRTGYSRRSRTATWSAGRRWSC